MDITTASAALRKAGVKIARAAESNFHDSSSVSCKRLLYGFFLHSIIFIN
jgi:hypothetical protein